MGKLPYIKGLKSYFPHRGLSEQNSIRSQHLKNLKESQCLGSEIRQGAAGSRTDKQRLPACTGKMQSVSFPCLACLYLRITEKELHRGKGKQWHFTEKNVSVPSSLTPFPQERHQFSPLCPPLWEQRTIEPEPTAETSSI